MTTTRAFANKWVARGAVTAQRKMWVGLLLAAVLLAACGTPAQPPADSVAPPVVPTLAPLPTNTAVVNDEQPAADAEAVVLDEPDAVVVAVTPDAVEEVADSAEIPPDQLPIAPAEPISNPSGGMAEFRFDRLARATVHVALLDRDFNILGYGSGTILSKDGVILTNAHVARPSALGIPNQDPTYLGIELLEAEDEPPVATYLADVVAVDGLLDLAVLRVASYLDGSAVPVGELNLPTVPLGDSDLVRLGEDIFIFGYPGIGGDTITFTRGSVAGFSSQERIGSRAWIKTDAAIAGGNSGGLATNSAGQIIGVPTQASAGNSAEVTDCRVVQDTNGDGRLDGRDNCIPIGGFINAIRPINLAKPLIQAALAQTAYASPFESAGSTAIAVGQGDFSFSTWSRDFDGRGCAVEPVSTFPSGSDKLVAVFAWNGIPDGTDVRYTWRLDNEIVVDDVVAWSDGSSGTCFPFWVENGGQALPDGNYDLTLTVGSREPRVVTVATAVGGGAVVVQPVQVEGRVVAASTGRGIAEAYVIVLKPGYLIDQWLDEPVYEAIYTSADTDSDGYYVLPDLLERGVTYEAAVVAEGYSAETGYLEMTDDDGDIVTIDIALRR